MSRFICTDEDGNSCAYGLDHAVGWFFQCEAKGIDEDTMFTGLSRGTLINYLSRTDANPGRISAIAADLDPAEYDEVMKCQ
jgi:hypothetical protein